MFWNNSSSTNRTTWCLSLNEDVLKLVIEQVDSFRGISNICQVSRQFHQVSVVEHYRDIDPNISTPSHRRLLHRLGSDPRNSLVSAQIRPGHHRIAIISNTFPILATVMTQEVAQLPSLCPKSEEFWVDLVYGVESPTNINDLIIKLAQI